MEESTEMCGTLMGYIFVELCEQIMSHIFVELCEHLSSKNSISFENELNK